MIIPYQELSADVLNAIIEDFVSREGTDYGTVESSFSSKVSQVMAQLHSGEATITFDVETESCSIVPAKS
jgi:uncharacterized protein YheU (UPF0270 family)